MSISVAELIAAAQDPAWADEQRHGAHLTVDLEGAPALTPEDLAGLGSWLHALPIPVIGVSAAEEYELSPLMDVLAGSDEELQMIAAGIEANPQAAAVLVQVLRSTETMAVIQALTVESLAYATLQSGAEFARWLAARRQQKRARVLASHDELVLLERDESELRLVLNSPASRNSLSAAMRDALSQAFRLVAMDPGIETVSVSGNGPSFCAGGDLEEFGLLENPAAAHGIRMLRMPARYLVPEASRYHFHVHGACIGAGIELPAFAAKLTAAADAAFRLPEVSMGLIPGAGGCVSIPRRIGRQRTALMALTSRAVGAEEALAWGLIDQIG
jgi:enoyl-CoA hydratase/carnithine racemase